MTTLELIHPPTSLEVAEGFAEHDATVIINAHPDDELMTAFMAMQTAVMASTGTTREAHIIVATDGEDSTVGNQAFVRSGRRRHEGMNSANAMGFSAPNVFQPGWMDGGLAEDPDLTQKLYDYFQAHGITTAVTLGPGGGDGHPDHIALHDATVETGIRTYALNGEGAGEALKLTPSAVERRRKLGAVAMNRSQLLMVHAAPNRIVPDGWQVIDGFMMPARVAGVMRSYKHFRETETYDLINAG